MSSFLRRRPLRIPRPKQWGASELDGAEVSQIQSHDRSGTHAFRHCHDSPIHQAQTQVGIGFVEFPRAPSQTSNPIRPEKLRKPGRAGTAGQPERSRGYAASNQLPEVQLRGAVMGRVLAQKDFSKEGDAGRRHRPRRQQRRCRRRSSLPAHVLEQLLGPLRQVSPTAATGA